MPRTRQRGREGKSLPTSGEVLVQGGLPERTWSFLDIQSELGTPNEEKARRIKNLTPSSSAMVSRDVSHPLCSTGSWKAGPLIAFASLGPLGAGSR